MKFASLSPNIGVKNVRETVGFYTNLGFNLVMSNPEEGTLQWAMVNHGDVNLMFQEYGSLFAEYPMLAETAKPGLSFFVKVKDMHELYEKVKGTNMIAKEMGKTFYGADEFAIIDNNGYVLTISEAD